MLREASGHDGQIFFTNSGAESNECAIKLARKWGGRGRHSVVSALGSFHGRTLASLAATGQPSKHEPFQPMPEGFKHVAWGDLDAMRAAVDASVAAVLIEPLQGEGGVNPAPPGYLEGIRQLCDETGALMMIDEIQTGFGRTGRWFGFEHSGVAPDVVTLAKAMGNGMPVGACWARRDVAAVFQPGDHGSTYSGTAIATAAVVAVIDEMRRIDAPALARERGAFLRELVSAIPGVSSVRGDGLLLGAQLDEGIDAPTVYTRMLENGIICNAVNPTTIRLAPPLTVTEAELDRSRGRAPQRPRTGPDVMARDLLDITDLSRGRDRDDPRSRPTPVEQFGSPARRTGCRVDLREAVEPHPSLDGDRGRATRRPPGVHAGRGSRLRRARAGRGRRTDPRGVPRLDRGEGVRALGRRAPRRLPSTSPSSTCCRTAPTRCRPWPTSLTMQQLLGDLAGRTVAWVGDYNNVARSLGEVCALLGMHLRFACPPGYDAADAELERLALLGAASVAQSDAGRRGGRRSRRGAHRHLGVDGAGGRQAGADHGVRVVHGRRDGDVEGGARVRSSCTACRRTAASR